MHRIEAYVTLAIIIILGISILYLPIMFFLKKKGVEILRQISYLLLFCSFFLIVFATIFFVRNINFKPERYILNLQPFDWLKNIKYIGIDNVLAETIPNIIMFIPLGLLIPVVFISKRKLYKTIIIVFAISFSAEFIQYFIGRSSDIDDIITNVLGGIIGYGIFKICSKLLRDKLWWKKFSGFKET